MRAALSLVLATLLLMPGITPAFAVSPSGSTVSAPGRDRADAGYYFNVEIRSDGTLWAWGYNSYGQLGDGTWVTKTKPVQVGADRDWATVSAGDSHVLAVKTDGTLWAWGWNDCFALGLGDNDSHYVPTQVGADTGWVSVAAGEMHSLGLKSDGTLWAWGDNGYGQLGQGDYLADWVPTRVGSGADWVSIAAGGYASAAIRADGTLWMWGDNTQGQIGQGDSDPCITPQQVTGSGWVSVSLGKGHTVGLKSDGTLWTWGNNAMGQLGQGTTGNELSPVRVTQPDVAWRGVGTGVYHTFAVADDGSMWAAGFNSQGQLGLGDTASRNVLTQVGSYVDAVSVSGGYSHTLGVRSDGSTWVSGDNSLYQLGDGTGVSRTTFGRMGGFSDWVAASSGIGHTLAIAEDGTLWSTGLNAYGELGIGDTFQRNLFTRVGTGTDWEAVDAGDYQSVALKKDGSLWVWGYNADGTLGLGDNTDRLAPTRLGLDTDWAMASTGGYSTLAIKQDGTLWAWGDNPYGQLGIGDTSEPWTPTQVGTDEDWATVACAGYHTLAIKQDGTLWAWGYGGVGALGLGPGDTGDHASPVQVGTDTDWLAVSGGESHSVALKTDGSMWAWGANYNGQLGIGAVGTCYEPTRVGSGSDWVSVAAGAQQTFAVRGSDGTLWGAGKNDTGQLGLGDSSMRSVLTRLGEGTSWTHVAPGFQHSVALRSDGALIGWGWNPYGQLGLGYLEHQYSPRLLKVGRAAAVGGVAPAFSLGYMHVLSIKGDGTLWAWGDNAYGQLADGSTVSRPWAQQVGADDDWVSVSGGDYHSMAIMSDGTLWAWGRNAAGQLGVGDKADRTGITRVGSEADWVSVAAGEWHTLGLKSDGTLWAWGYNGNGELGLGDTDDRLVPTKVGTSNDWVAVAAGGAHSLALKSDGTLWAWGENSYGQLGLDDTSRRTAPTQVPGSGWTSVSAGARHSMATKAGGTLWAWGDNGYWQLGLGDGVSRDVPTQVAGTGWASVSAGYRHSLGVKSDGSLWAWGYNNKGQLGLGNTASVNIPTEVGGANHVGCEAGGNLSFVSDAFGHLQGAGYNYSGQLGVGTTTDSTWFVSSFAPGDVVTPSVLAMRSTTHPFSSATGPQDFSAVLYAVDVEFAEYAPAGISWEIDRSDDTVPDDTWEITGASGAATATDLGAGVWYLHVRAQDAGRNWSETEHYMLTVNAPPDAVDDSYETAEDEALHITAPGLLTNDSDPDGDDLTITSMSNGAHGAVSHAGDGSFSYTPSADWYGTDTFTYTVSDGNGGTDEATVTVSVTPVNDAPVAVADSYSTPEDTALVVGSAGGVLANDSDVDHDPISAVKVSDPAHGTLSLAANGAFTYTPEAGWNGTDSFTYKANDGQLDSNVVTVSLTVTPVEDPPVIEIAGPDRFVTAVEASLEAYPSGLDPSGAKTVVIATGRNWPDALGGSALAGALDGPLLLTEPGSLPAAVAAEIERLGAEKAIILGGEAAVLPAVKTALEGIVGAGKVDRIWGADRYETAEKVALRTIALLGTSYDGTAFVATGGNFPDALGASPLAAANGWPLLLVHPTTGLSDGTVAALAEVDEVVILGGEAVVKPETEEYLIGMYGEDGVTRIAGLDRYDTAARVAGFGVSNAGLGWNRVAIATGTNFPDALAGGVLQGKVGSVMLLTRPTALDPYTRAALVANKSHITTVTFFGGTGALPQPVRDAVTDALK